MMGKRLKEIFGLILINITLVSGSLNAETVYSPLLCRYTSQD